MKNSFLILLFALCFNTSWADFLDTAVWSHPLYAAANEPYLLDISGDWSSDCHPGEQKPVISEYTGDSALIEFETITDHVTCNDVVTPYRVLVDMSDVIESVPGEFPFIDVTIRFGGAEYMKRVMRPCLLCSPVPPPRDVKPEAGLYYSNGLKNRVYCLPGKTRGWEPTRSSMTNPAAVNGLSALAGLLKMYFSLSFLNPPGASAWIVHHPMNHRDWMLSAKYPC